MQSVALVHDESMQWLVDDSECWQLVVWNYFRSANCSRTYLRQSLRWVANTDAILHSDNIPCFVTSSTFFVSLRAVAIYPGFSQQFLHSWTVGLSNISMPDVCDYVVLKLLVRQHIGPSFSPIHHCWHSIAVALWPYAFVSAVFCQKRWIEPADFFTWRGEWVSE